MSPEVNKILEYWVEFSEFDPDQRQFMLGSLNYDWNVVSKHIRTLISDYDENGYLACLYLKNKYRSTLKDHRVPICNMLENSEEFKEFQTMYNLLYSSDMDSIEKKFRDLCDRIIASAYGPSNFIGNIEIDKLLSYLEDLVENIPRCRAEILLDSSIDEIKIENINGEIAVFNTVAECIFALNTAKDNTMYLCYITSRGSLDGYFSYMLKSNGNIISINDRVPESYIGEHKNHRNGRWMEEKQYSIFPYESFVEWSGCDYKGYATKVETKVESLKLMDLKEEDLIRVLLGGILIMNKYSRYGKVDLKSVYTISLLEQNRDAECTALITRSENALVASTYNKLNELVNSINQEKITAPGEEYDFCANDNIFIKLFGEGFKFDPSTIMQYDQYLSLVDGKSTPPDAEFLGNETSILGLVVSEGRKQLADYIRERMMQEYIEFGGLAGLQNWWKDALNRHIRNIILLCCCRYQAYSERGRDASGNYITLDTLKNVRLTEDEINRYSSVYNLVLNDSLTDDTFKCISSKAGVDSEYTANIWFDFRPYSDKNLSVILENEELPRVVQGYSSQKRMTHTNSILNLSDEVERIGCPYEYYIAAYFNEELKDRISSEENCPRIFADSRERYHKEKRESYSFHFSLGFSRRELKKLFNGTSKLNEFYQISKEDISNFIDSYRANNPKETSTAVRIL